MVADSPTPQSQIRGHIHRLLISHGDSAYYVPLLEFLCTSLGADWCRLIYLDDDGQNILDIHAWAREADQAIPIPSRLPHKPGPLALRIHHHHPALGASDAGPLLATALVLNLAGDTHPYGLLEWAFIHHHFPRARLAPLLPAIPLLREGLAVLRHNVARKHELESLRRKVNYELDIVRLLFRHSHDLIVTCDAQGRILQINDAGRAMLGLGEGDDLGALHLENPVLSVMFEMIGPRECLNDLELVLLATTGEPLFFQGNIIPIRDANGSISAFHAICKNINEHIIAQRELWMQNHQLQELNETLVRTQAQSIQNEKLASIGQLSAGIAHEINNPLAFIKSNHEVMEQFIERLYHYIDGLESKAGNVRESRQQARVDRILIELPRLMKESRDGFARIMEIIQSLKDFSRQDKGTGRQNCDINQLLKETLVVARNHYKNIAHLEQDYQLASLVAVYPGLLNQAFLNLVVNAAQAIANSGRSDMGTIRICTRRERDCAMILVSDDGPGIPDDAIDHLFEPFFTTKPIGQGTGLGLSVSYDIVVKRHGGRMEAHNRAQGGAEFIICLPLDAPLDLETVDSPSPQQ